MKIPNSTEIRKNNSFFNININLIRNVLFFSGGIILFMAGVIVYGVIINMRDVPLRKAMFEKGIHKITDPSIIIDRRTYSLMLFQDTLLVKTYRANFGRNVNSPKTRAGDLSTPVGDYKICQIDTAGKYYKFFEINYPNINDAGEALRKGRITQAEYDTLKYDNEKGICPDPHTVLGGDVGIHGIGRLNYIFRFLPFNYNWTDGSVAISNEGIDELYSVVKKGTNVIIK